MMRVQPGFLMSSSGGEALGGLAAGEYDLSRQYAGIGADLSAASIERKLGLEATEARARANEYAGRARGFGSAISGLISAVGSLGAAGIKAGQVKTSRGGGLDGSWKEYATKPDMSW